MALRFVLVVEGVSEYGAIPVLLRTAGYSPMAIMQFGGQAIDCDVTTLVDRCLVKHTWLAMLKQPDKVIVVLDRENRPDCPGQFASAIRTELIRQLTEAFRYSGAPCLNVVCADRKLENWLIADPAEVAKHSYISRSFASKVGNNADSKDAEAIIKAAYRSGTQYHKRRDAPRLALRVRTNQPAVRNRSDSLDKLLREVSAL